MKTKNINNKKTGNNDINNNKYKWEDWSDQISDPDPFDEIILKLDQDSYPMNIPETNEITPEQWVRIRELIKEKNLFKKN